jgi:RIO kinase 1
MDLTQFNDFDEIDFSSSASPRHEKRRPIRPDALVNPTSVLDDQLLPFIEDGWISSVGPVLKTGKEAIVYRCPGGNRLPEQEVAIKVHKSMETRSFKAMSGYLEGRFYEAGMNRRNTLHALSSPNVLQSMWVSAEWEKLNILHRHGIRVPVPYFCTDCALAMEFVGNESAAPRLVDYPLSETLLHSMGRSVLHSIHRMLELDVVHGDLSCYNILIHQDQAVLIDFPQAVNPRFNSQACAMLERDIRNILSFFELEPDPPSVARALAEEWWMALEDQR